MLGHHRRLVPLAAVVALAGCGGSDAPKDSATPAPTATTASVKATTTTLPVLRSGDLAGATVKYAVDLKDAAAKLDFDRSHGLAAPDEAATAKRLGLQRAAAAELALAGGGNGFSTAERYPSHAAAVKANRPATPKGVTVKPVPGLGDGHLDTFADDTRVGRNVYFVKGDTAFWIGYSADKGQEPGAAKLLAAAKAVAARAS